MVSGQVAARKARKRRTQKTVGTDKRHYEQLKEYAQNEGITMLEALGRVIDAFFWSKK